METFRIEGVEIFSVGTWNGDTFTLADLLEMARAFTENKQHFRPYLKLGHDKDQKLLQIDGLPAAGWVENLYVKNNTLCADFVEIPKKIYELVAAGAYKNVSCEIYTGVEIDKQQYGFLVGAVAILGADVPGVMNLDSILAMYKKIPNLEKEQVKIYSQKKFEFTDDKTQNNNKGAQMEKTEKEIQLETKLEQTNVALAAKETELKAAADKLAEGDKAIAELKEFKAKAEKDAIEAIAAQKVAEVQKFSAELVSKKLCTPAMKPLIEALMGDDKKEYSVKVGKDDKKLSKTELLEEALKLFSSAKEVNFEPTTEDKKDSDATDEAVEAEILKYSKDNNVKYSVAAKAVFKNKSNKES